MIDDAFLYIERDTGSARVCRFNLFRFFSLLPILRPKDTGKLKTSQAKKVRAISEGGSSAYVVPYIYGERESTAPDNHKVKKQYLAVGVEVRCASRVKD